MLMNDSVARPIRFKFRLTEFAIFAAAFSVLIFFIIWYLSRERFIYFWDLVNYQVMYANLGPRFARNWFEALHSVYNSIRQNDYNLLPVLFLMPFRLAFGPGRLSFILSIAVTFVFPAMVLFLYTVRSLTRNTTGLSSFGDAGLALISVLAFAFFPVLWVPVLLGSVDAGGVIIIYAVLVLYFRADLVEQSFRSLLSMALLLCLLVLFRRWYAYWVVGFFGAVAICEGLRYATVKERRPHCLRIAKNIFILGFISFLSFFLIATPIARRMLATDYGEIYSGYRSSHPYIHNLGALYNHFGLLTLFLAGLGVLASAANAKRRPVVCFLCLQFAITFVLLARTQDFVLSSHGRYVGVQHFYWAVATLALFIAFFARDLFLLVPTRAGRVAVLLITLAAIFANFAGTFLPRAGRFLAAIDFALPNARQYPMVRTDLDQVRRLLDTLDDLTKGSNETIYTLASSFTLNSSVVMEACLELEPFHSELSRKIVATNDIDKRDGFPLQLLNTDYVVLTTPVGYHLAPADQRVIGLFADQLVTGEGIGKSYDRLNYEFRLEDGSTAIIFRRSRPIGLDPVYALSRQLIEFYPQHAGMFELPPTLIRKLAAF